jgi:hypothetical protein
MALYVYNLTGSPVALVAGSPIVTVPASAAPPSRSKPYNVTAELKPDLTVDPVNGKAGGVLAAGYASLQVQVNNDQLVFEWTSEPEYLTPGLTVSTPGDEDPNLVKQTIAVMHVYADSVIGHDTNNDGLEKSAGTGGSFSALAGVVTFTGTGAAWTSADVGRLLTINYATNPDNNGSFAIISVPAGNQVTYANAFGVTEAMPAGGKWTVSSPKLTIQAAANLIPEIHHNTCLHLSGATSFTGTPTTIEKRLQTMTNFVIDGGSATKPISMFNGTGDTLAAAAGVVTLTDAGAAFTSALIGKTINIGASTTAGHLGNWTITGVLSPTQLTWANAAGGLPASEAYTGIWTIYPFDEVRTGTGDNLAFGGGIVTLTDAGASFTQADVGKQILIAGSTTPANDGTFTIATVVDNNNVTFANASGVTEAFTGTWTLGSFVANAGTTSVTTLGLLSLGWSTDQWAGAWVEILTGPAAGQTRTVQGNTATTITPVRSFSVNPGACQFRFVRPTTSVTSSIFALGVIGATTTGSYAGFTSLQNLTLAPSCQFQLPVTHTYLNMCGLFITSLNPFPINVFGAAVAVITGNRVNPHTFATESTTANTQCGMSQFNRLRIEYLVNVGVLMRGLTGMQIGQSFLAHVAVQHAANDVFIFWRGTRILSLHVTHSRGNNLSGSVPVSTGYATTRFGGHPSKASMAGLLMEGSWMAINTCIIDGWNDYGIHLNQSGLMISGSGVSGTMAKAGMYMHSNSVCHLRSGVTPTLSGTLLGNITTDEVTLASTWAAIAAGTPMIAASEMSLAKVFDNPIRTN